MKLQLAMELKKENQRKEDALVRFCESLEETIDTEGNTFDSEFEVFAVVQAGPEIGFLNSTPTSPTWMRKIFHTSGVVFPSPKTNPSMGYCKVQYPLNQTT